MNRFTVSSNADPTRVARTIRQALDEANRRNRHADRVETTVRTVAILVGLALAAAMFWWGR